MSRYHLVIRVKPRPGLLDPQGKAIHGALRSLGWPEVDDVRVGKAIYLDMDAASETEALEKATAMCRKLLANPVTEDFEVGLAGQLRNEPRSVPRSGPMGVRS